MNRFALITLLLCGPIFLLHCSKKSPTKFDMSEYYLGPDGAEISIFRRDWNLASAPQDIGGFSDHLNWYNPPTQYPKKFIRPSLDVPNTVAQTTNILKVVFELKEKNNDVSGGIMQYIGDYSGLNFTDRDYLEIMINGQNGVLHIDIGAMSEDVIPNAKLDTEDLVPNGKLESNEDMGLDGMANIDPRALAAGGDFWDINGNGEKDETEPFSMDDWKYERYDPDEDYTRINGSEGNANDASGQFPDTEDVNGNGELDLANDYWTFEIQLQPDHPDNEKYVFEKAINEDGSDFGWRWYKIPLSNFQKVGSPSHENVESIRFWMTGKNYYDQGLPVWFAFITFTSDAQMSR